MVARFARRCAAERSPKRKVPLGNCSLKGIRRSCWCRQFHILGGSRRLSIAAASLVAAEARSGLSSGRKPASTNGDARAINSLHYHQKNNRRREHGVGP